MSTALRGGGGSACPQCPSVHEKTRNPPPANAGASRRTSRKQTLLFKYFPRVREGPRAELEANEVIAEKGTGGEGGRKGKRG